MAIDPNRINFHSPAEAVFINFRRWVTDKGFARVPPMPIYDFGRLIDEDAPEFIGRERFDAIFHSQIAWLRKNRLRLPHEKCALLLGYIQDKNSEFFFLGIGEEAEGETIFKWIDWQKPRGWREVLQQTYTPENKIANQWVVGFENTNPTKRLKDVPHALTSAMLSGLWMVYERGGAVIAMPSDPAPSRTASGGRLRVHPLAPSSVIRIRVSDPRLLRVADPDRVPATASQEPGERRPARGTTVHYKHPRYINMVGKIGFRRAQKGYSDPLDKPTTYEPKN